MSRRVVAGLLALGLIVVGAVLGMTANAPFVSFRPGPTVNVLGPNGDKQIISVTGHKTYRDDGALRLVTVYVTQPADKIGLFSALLGWADPDTAVLPYDAVYHEAVSNKCSQQQSAEQMTSSQDNATAAALSALDIKFKVRKLTAIAVAAVDAKGPANGVLADDDQIVSVDGKPVTSSDALIGAIQSKKPGSQVKLGIRRCSLPTTVTITTKASPDDPKQSRVGVSLNPTPDVYGLEGDFPFKVEINLSENIGGPSAGMMFALSIYDVLTPGSLTGGKVIAGSGEIDADGIVGPIGGIGQKLVGAQRDGAKLFLVAQENCAEAAKAHYDKDSMQLVKVHTLKQAIADVDAWRQNPDADLPGCS
jgi:PDZ domain-containing protein